MEPMEDLMYCPRCGAELLDTRPFHTGTRGTCPEHGRLFVEAHTLP